MVQVTSKDGTPIGYKEVNSKPLLLLVHGTTADHTRWLPISSDLEAHFSIYAMDRRGRGESGDAPEYSIQREAEDIAAVVDNMGKPVYVLGHSYGAICCLEAGLLTDNIRKLILYEPPLPNEDTPDTADAAARIQALVEEDKPEEGLEVFFREVVGMPEEELEEYRQLPVWEERIRLAPTISRELLSSKEYEFDEEKFSDYQVPTLLLLGGESPAHFREAIEILFSVLPGSLVVALPGQRHVAMDTAPNLFIEEMLKFLVK